MTVWECNIALCQEGFLVSDFGVERLGSDKNVDFRIYRKRTSAGVIECKIWMTNIRQDNLIQANSEAVLRALDGLEAYRVLEHCP